MFIWKITDCHCTVRAVSHDLESNRMKRNECCGQMTPVTFTLTQGHFLKLWLLEAAGLWWEEAADRELPGAPLCCQQSLSRKCPGFRPINRPFHRSHTPAVFKQGKQNTSHTFYIKLNIHSRCTSSHRCHDVPHAWSNSLFNWTPTKTI